MSSEWTSTVTVTVLVAVARARGRFGGAARFLQREAEERGSAAVRDEVRAREADAVDRRQGVLRVAAATGEARGGPGPAAVDAEPDPVRELERRRPDAAHLARDVPAVGVEATVLEADRVGARARRNLAPVLEERRGRGRARRLRGGGRNRGQSHGQDQRP